jgi:G3E family GTPase
VHWIQAEENRKWFETEWGESTPETDEYGVSSIVITSTRPFHPERLQRLLLAQGNLRLLGSSSSSSSGSKNGESGTSAGSVINQVIRAKGYIWMSSHPNHCIVLQIAGSNITLLKGSPWWSTIPRDKWPRTHEVKSEIVDTMHQVWGDRRQRLVVIGVHMDKAATRRAFDECLLTDAEMNLYLQHITGTKADGSGSIAVLTADPFGICMQADVHESNDRSSHSEL